MKNYDKNSSDCVKKKQEVYKVKRFLRKELRGKKDSFGVL